MAGKEIAQMLCVMWLVIATVLVTWTGGQPFDRDNFLHKVILSNETDGNEGDVDQDVDYFILMQSVTAIDTNNTDAAFIPTCFEVLGCLWPNRDFNDHKRRPFNPQPEAREKINTIFTLYSREAPEGMVFKGTEIPAKVSNSSFNATRSTKIIIHGFLSSVDADWVQEMVYTFLTYHDVNVIAVDWSKGARTMYWTATANVRVVSLEIAYLVNWLIEKVDLDPDDVHIIGHSLGAHGAGYAGERIYGLGRITGLDPAGVYFDDMPKSVRLDPSDAKFVDVIHTNPGVSSIGKRGLGTNNAVGDIDFYPNNGETQPGCGKVKLHPIRGKTFDAEVLIEADFHGLGCSHTRSARLFSDTIKSSCPYMAFMCESYESYLKGECTTCGEDGSRCSRMGLRAVEWRRPKEWKANRPKEPPRQFFLSTVSLPSPCQYHSVMDIELDRPLKHLQGSLTFAVKNNNGNATFVITPSEIPSEDQDRVGHHTFIVSHRHDLSDSCNGSAFVGWGTKGDLGNTTAPLLQITFRNLDASTARGEADGSRQLVWGRNISALFTVDSGHSSAVPQSYTCNVDMDVSNVDMDISNVDMDVSDAFDE